MADSGRRPFALLPERVRAIRPPKWWQEIAFVRDLRLSPQQLTAVRASLLRDFEQDSQENGYLLNAIARDYEESGGKNVAEVEHLPDLIAALSSTAIHDAAQAYLNTEHSVTVIQSPERR